MAWTSPNPQETAAGSAFEAAPRTPRKRVRAPLHTVGDVTAECSKIYREARSGLLSVEQASKLSYILVQIGRLLETSALEDRVAALESAGK